MKIILTREIIFERQQRIESTLVRNVIEKIKSREKLRKVNRALN